MPPHPASGGLGDTIVLTGTNLGVRMAVKVTAVTGPVRAARAAPAGKRYVGIRLRMKNTGVAIFESTAARGGRHRRPRPPRPCRHRARGRLLERLADAPAHRRRRPRRRLPALRPARGPAPADARARARAGPRRGRRPVVAAMRRPAAAAVLLGLLLAAAPAARADVHGAVGGVRDPAAGRRRADRAGLRARRRRPALRVRASLGGERLAAGRLRGPRLPARLPRPRGRLSRLRQRRRC